LPGVGTGPTDLGDFPAGPLLPNGEHDDRVDAAVYAADLIGVGNDFWFTTSHR
jgi:hypothetical protein